jgi:hypothetical protein
VGEGTVGLEKAADGGWGCLTGQPREIVPDGRQGEFAEQWAENSFILKFLY